MSVVFDLVPKAALWLVSAIGMLGLRAAWAVFRRAV